MKGLQIQGLVSLAARLRQELTCPIPQPRAASLRRLVDDTLSAVDGLLARYGVTATALSPRSRQAVQFLRGLDLGAAHPTAGARTAPVHFPGLRRAFLDLLAQLEAPGKTHLPATLARIARHTECLERTIADHNLSPEAISEESRCVRGWLAFFSRRENLQAYAAAVTCTADVFRGALRGTPGHHLPLSVHLRPMRGLFRWRFGPKGGQVSLPTPTITFEGDLFAVLAGLALRQRRNRHPVLEAMVGDAYQGVQAEIDSLGGVVEHPRGLHHDLAAAFERVNAAYFGDGLARPRLAWSHNFSRRKFGHYDPIRDTVMVSSSLDQARVPQTAVDFVMYHELLHKRLGISWDRGRARVHTPEFRRAERCFHAYAEAERILARLARPD